MKSVLKFIGVVVVIIVLIPTLFYFLLMLWGDWHDEWSGYNDSAYIGDGYCNIAVLPVQGEIHSYGVIYDEFGNEMVSTNATDAVTFLSLAETEPGILGVMTLINSTGGSAAAGEMITTELKKSQMPNAAYIADSGTSAAYLIATGADTIIASPFSDVGSIGVTMSYLDYSKQNADQGIDYIELTSAKFKDYANPDRVITEEEKALIKRDLSIWHDEFVKQVATNRNLPIEDIAKIADGSSLPGKLALENKLIDQLGDKETVRTWFANKLQISPAEVIFCE